MNNLSASLAETNLPKDWIVRPISQIGRVFSGSTPKTSEPRFWNGEVVWLTPDDLSYRNKYYNTSARKISRKGLKASSAKLIPARSIVISSRAPIGYLGIPTIPYSTNQGCKSIVPNGDFSEEYLYYFLHTVIGEMIRLGSGTTFSEISKAQLQTLKVVAPSNRKEQSKIAEVLSICDVTIDRTEAVITKYKRIRQGLIQELLSNGIDKQGNIRSDKTHQFKNSSIGLIPKDWKTSNTKRELYMKGRIGWQGLKRNEFLEYGNYLITGIHFNNDYSIDWKSCYHISDRRYNQAPEIQVKVNDILLTKDGTIGKLAFINYLPGKASLNSHILLLRPLKNNLLPKYIFYQLLSERFRKFVDNIKSGSTLSGLTQSSFGKFEIVIPPILEQEKIVNILTEIDVKIKIEVKLRNKLTSIKSGLLTDLFSGKVRVTPLMNEV